MNTSDRIGRNEPCPCGSEKKFKVCCGRTPDIVPASRRSPWIVGGLAVVGLAVVATAALRRDEPKASEVSRSYSPPAPFSSPPIGMAGSSAPAIPVSPAPGALATQPPGPAPEGKVWSPEHGHWHDAPGAAAPVAAGAGEAFTPELIPVDPATFVPPAANPSAPVPQPDGPVPEGKVWSSEHGHWHDAPAPVAPPVTPGPQ